MSDGDFARLFELGNQMSNAGKWAEAVEHYGQALQVEPRHEWALNSRGYRITDAYCDPPGLTEHLHSEKLIRLERGFICFKPPDKRPSPVLPPVTQNGHVTFGSVNKPTKVSPSAFRTWAAILKQVPHSRLRVKYGGSFDSEGLRERW